MNPLNYIQHCMWYIWHQFKGKSQWAQHAFSTMCPCMHGRTYVGTKIVALARVHYSTPLYIVRNWRAKVYAAPSIEKFTLHIAIKSSSISLINLRAAETLFCRGEMSFHIGISQNGIGETLRSSASLRTV